MEIDSPQSENCRTYETRKKNKDLLCRMCGKRASKQTKNRKGKRCSNFVGDLFFFVCVCVCVSLILTFDMPKKTRTLTNCVSSAIND